MGSSRWLATVLDQEMLERVRGIVIAARTVPDDALPTRRGPDVAAEIGERYLLRYMLPQQVGQLRRGTSDPQFVTPTPLAPEATVPWLFLPRPEEARVFVMALDAARVPEIKGPRWVRCGPGIEYLLPGGFPPDAIVWPWEMQVE